MVGVDHVAELGQVELGHRRGTAGPEAAATVRKARRSMPVACGRRRKDTERWLTTPLRCDDRTKRQRAPGSVLPSWPKLPFALREYIAGWFCEDAVGLK